MCPPRGTTLLVLLLVVYLLVISGRTAFREESRPAVSVENRREIRVLLEDGFPERGVHQFNDGIDLITVIELTVSPERALRLSPVFPNRFVVDGESLCLVVKDNEIVSVNGGWMPASQRMAIGIKLHPDRMTQQDWESLPGIGMQLAERIEENRQKNGEFGSLESLKRVRGVGSKSIQNWSSFF